uniref:Murine leukemia virus integrase C-terminal domain-containing protein n=1 Tax=Knipowitschia caucasica TaxID=637954 RepID=A0AAV2KPS2_KNICA
MTLFVDGSCYRDGAALKAGYAISQTKEEEVPPTVKPGDLVYVKTFRRKWHSPRREGPYEVVNATSTAVQVKGSPTWYHLNH